MPSHSSKAWWKQTCLVGLANYSYLKKWEGGNLRGAGNSLAAVPSPRYKRRNLLQAPKKKKKKDKSLLQAINSFIGQNLYIFDTAYRQQLIGSHTLPKHHLGFSIDSCPYINLQCSFSYKVHKAERTAVKIWNDGKMILNYNRSLLMRHRQKIPLWLMTPLQSDIALHSSPHKKNTMSKVNCYPLPQRSTNHSCFNPLFPFHTRTSQMLINQISQKQHCIRSNSSEGSERKTKSELWNLKKQLGMEQKSAYCLSEDDFSPHNCCFQNTGTE